MSLIEDLSGFLRKDSLVFKYGKRHVLFVAFAFTFLGAQCLLYAKLQVSGQGAASAADAAAAAAVDADRM